LPLLNYTKDAALEYSFAHLPKLHLCNEPVISAFSDSDWGSDIQDRKSQAGWAIFYRNAVIGWKSKKLPTISLSTAAAEYSALSLLGTELEALHFVLRDCENQQLLRVPMPVGVDNNAAIAITSNSGYVSQVKNIDMKIFYARQLQDTNMIKVQYVKSSDNTADIFTKALTKFLHKKHAENLLGQPLTTLCSTDTYETARGDDTALDSV